MRRALFIVILALVGSPVAAQDNSACGWYAITACKPTYEEATNYAKRTGSGFVINTSSPSFSNFANGYFCVVSGPLDRDAALGAAEHWRNVGVSPNAYAKQACN